MRHLIRSAPVILLAVLALGVVPSCGNHDVWLAAVPVATGGCGHLVAALSVPLGLSAPLVHSSPLPVTAGGGAPTPAVTGIFHPPRPLL
ncbi:MAG: hypothetical protein HYV08_16430 [Deltaproteobacteria bacterium]|nr:hypothetical protein [Deltaproteobacteria bacterium]